MDPELVNYHYCDDLPTRPLPPGTRVLVTGANGYVAHRLIPELIFRGYHVLCMFRNRRCPPILSHPRIENVYADCLTQEQLRPILQGIEVAYYLIHSMRLKKDEFVEIDKRAAQNFGQVAEECGVRKIIYLGGLGELGERLSPHLRSRRQVGEILATRRIPVIRLRAAIIIGTGSASYELLKSLVLHNRWIPFLPEFNSLCQPVAIRDVIKYLVGMMEIGELPSRIYQIGGQDVLRYRDLILKFSEIAGRKVKFFDVSWIPLKVELMCRLYASWLHLFIAIPVNITSLLLGSLKTDVVCTEKDIRSLLPFEPLDFKTAVTWAQEKEKQSKVHSHWSDVPPEKMSDLMPLYEYESSHFKIDEHSIDIPADPDVIFPIICRVGGNHGWAHANLLWEIRGWIDRMIGGVGLIRGRRDANQLRVGDAVDFWRVEKIQAGTELLLRAEMISPGFSWLQFELVPGDYETTRVVLRAHFIPKPFWGDLYWLLMSKFHSYIFQGMLKSFRREALETIQKSGSKARDQNDGQIRNFA